jgi:hypothetical protein
MRTQSFDTYQSTEKILIELQRGKSISRKFAQIRSLSATVMRLSRRAINRSKKPVTEIEANLLFVELHYGSQLADRLTRYLQANLQ